MAESFIEEMIKLKHEKVFEPFTDELKEKYYSTAVMPTLSILDNKDVIRFLEIYKKQRPKDILNKEDKLFDILHKK